MPQMPTELSLPTGSSSTAAQRPVQSPTAQPASAAQPFTLADGDGFNILRNLRANFDKNYGGEWARSPTLYKEGDQSRVPVIITTEEMASQGRYIIFWTGVESANWDLKQRGVLQRTRGGFVQHYFRDAKRNTYYDEPEIQFVFQSGNIMPARITTKVTNLDPKYAKDGTLVQVPFGLMNLYEFLELLDQKKAMADGRVNYVYILYSSMVFPKMVLRGVFSPETGTNFQEAAMNGAEVKWHATFRVMGSYPKFNSAESLKATWLEMQRRQGWTVATDETAFTTLPTLGEPQRFQTQGQTVTPGLTVPGNVG